MTTGTLLEVLIEIAGISKSEFAMDTFMTPSGLSLILSGKRLPGLKDKEDFCLQAASVLAGHIYEPNCFPKLQGTFPVIYDFHSRHELESFLQLALEYVIDRDLALANEQELDYPDHGKFYLGDMRILNKFCVILSDCQQCEPEADLVVYSSLPIFSHEYPPFLNRMRFTNGDNNTRVKLHQAIFSVENETKPQPPRAIDTITRIQDFCDLNFWQADPSLSKNYILLKDHVLIFFDQLLDQSWSMTVVKHKNYVHHFYEEMKARYSNLLSFDRDQFKKEREKGNNFIKELLDLEITHVFNFAPIGYTLNDEELAEFEDSADQRRMLLDFFEKVLTGDTKFYFSDICLQTIADEGRLVVPLHGIVELPRSERVPYLNRVVKYYEQDASREKFKLIYTNAPRMCLVCTPELSLIYTIDHNLENEKVHFFYGNNLGDSFLKQIEEEAGEIAVFTVEWWNDFLQRWA